MTAKARETTLDWRPGDVPVSRCYGDPYFSKTDGLAESRQVFLAGTGLAARFLGACGARVAELGFGTGLNCVATWMLWQHSAAPGAALDYTAFEIAPLSAGEMRRALGSWPEIAPQAEMLTAAWSGPGRYVLPGLRLSVIPGDARATLPAWSGCADAWFLDGFAPAKNPELWEPELIRAVFARTAPGGRLATYSAAGHVRRSLAAAGFSVEKRPGFAAKREMLAAWRPPA